MKLLMTTDTVGGVWTYALQLAKSLAPHDVEVLLAAKGSLSADQQAAAEALANVTLFTADFKLEWMDDPWDDVAEAHQWLLEIARSVQPDIVHLNDYCHGALDWPAPAMVVGHSCVLSWLSAVEGAEADGKWDRYREVVADGLHGADWVAAPSHYMLSELRRFYGPLNSASVIFNGCDPPRLPAEEKQPVVFSAGRMWDKAKNIAALAAAAPWIDWPVQVAGMPHPDGHDGSDESLLNNVQWLGRLTPAEMMRRYTTSAVYALPALYEPFGLTPLEAALRGCALVLGDIPTLREIWGDAACFVDPRDPRDLADAVNRLCRDASLRRDYAGRAEQVARKLTADQMAAQYYRLYGRLIGNRLAAASL